MTNKNYRKGYRFEQRVKKYLEDKGYFVIRSGKSAFPDLVAIPETCSDFKFPLIVECKLNHRYLSKKERKKLKDLENTYNCIAVVASREGREIVFRTEIRGRWTKWRF